MSAAPTDAGGRHHAFAPPGELPQLGSRGEGWVALQFALMGAVAAAGLRGPRWPAKTRRARRLSAGLALLTGASMMVRGGRDLGHQLTPYPRPVTDGALRQDGIYSLARHPMYGGVMLVMTSVALASSPATLAPLALAATFLDLKRRREESWLVEEHPDYEEYRVRVPHHFIPFLW
jgi:protein-S-isoprenylcysteine O-methyltransferase Ste14